jgi:uncharacterized membrane protein
MDWLNLLFRWVHVVAGVMWIGHLWFFNFVNSQLAKTYTADSKKAVLPELMPRALYWFRWGAAYTWVSGFLLMGLVYYMGGGLIDPDKGVSNGLASAVSLISILVIFFIYDVLWKSLGKNEKVAAAVSFVLFWAALYGMSCVFSGRALYIHAGALFGTIMAMNVWMRIWPAQRKIIAGVKGTAAAPDASVAAMAGLRSKHNTYMSVPLIFFMVSNHYPTVYGSDFAWVAAGLFILVGWGITKWLYGKSAAPATARF